MNDMNNMGLDIAAGRTQEFFKAAQTLSDCINRLDLNKEDNDKLVALAIAQVQEAERGAFHYALKIGVEFGRYPYCKEEKKDE